MKIYYKKCNINEKYCCTLKVVKEIFNDTKIKINFGAFGRKYNPLSNEPGYNYFKKKIKGDIIAKLFVEYGNCNPMLSFYVVKEESFTTNLKEEFENKILLEMLEFYKKTILLNNKFSFFLVELINNQLITHIYNIN